MRKSNWRGKRSWRMEKDEKPKENDGELEVEVQQLLETDMEVGLYSLVVDFALELVGTFFGQFKD